MVEENQNEKGSYSLAPDVQIFDPGGVNSESDSDRPNTSEDSQIFDPGGTEGVSESDQAKCVTISDGSPIFDLEGVEWNSELHPDQSITGDESPTFDTGGLEGDGETVPPDQCVTRDDCQIFDPGGVYSVNKLHVDHKIDEMVSLTSGNWVTNDYAVSQTCLTGITEELSTPGESLHQNESEDGLPGVKVNSSGAEIYPDQAKVWDPGGIVCKI